MTETAKSSAAYDPDANSEYEVVAFGDYWGVLSLLFFAASLTTRYLVRLLPVRGYASLPPLSVKAVPVLALVGVVAALAGLRRSKNNSLARFALFVNLVVLGLSALLVIAALIYFASRR